jgi:hypothetical protein
MQECMIKRCCDGSNDVFWIEDITKLFCSLSPFPSGDVSSAQRLNAVTRLILYIFLFMLAHRYKYRFHFILLSLFFILYMYKVSLETEKKENYAFLSFSNNKDMNFDTVSTNIHAKPSHLVLNKNPTLKTYTNVNMDDMQSFVDANGNLLPDNVIQERLEYGASQIAQPIYSRNMTNNYQGSSSRALKAANYRFEGGQRETNAGIQYFPIHQGVNRKTMVEPVIAPPSYDLEFWGKSSINMDRINRRNYTDLTEDELFRTQQPPGALGAETHYRSRVNGAVEPMNDVNDDAHDGFYGAGNFLPGGYGMRDFSHNIAPMYDPETNPNATLAPIYEPTNVEKVEPNRWHNHINDENPYHKKNNNKKNFDLLDKDDMLNDFDTNQYSDLTLQANPNIPNDGLFIPKDPSLKDWYKPSRKILDPLNPSQLLEGAKNIIQNMRETPATLRGDSQRESTIKEGFAFENVNTKNRPPFQNVNSVNNISQTFGQLGKTTPVSSLYNKISQYPDSTVPPNASAVTEQLLNASPTYVYDDKFFEDPTRKLFLQDIQPKIYSWSVEQTPINSNLGISYTPQRPPRIHTQIESANAAYPLYTRIDPQLVRDDGTEGQKQMNPIRTDWSANYSSWNPAPGTINFENIYDPRFTSYGDSYRSYSDVNLGQVHYYYSDVDAYTMPNFLTRSNVDFVEYRTPQNQVWSEYNRTASVNDVKPHVESQFTADDLFHREDLMERQMAKVNRGKWQNRVAPLRRSANSSMPYGPT